MLVAAGLTLVAPQFQALLTRLATPLANSAIARQDALDRFGLLGQAAIGIMLSLVWSPCVGQTLGAVTALAAQGQVIGQAAVVMRAFSLGIASVLLATAFAGRGLLARWRGRMLSTGSGGKRVMGAVLAAVGLFVFSGLDRSAEKMIVIASPDCLINVTTAF